jgi:predicted membrane channel-forming protein YqfA (hemolysin III family)
METEMEEETFSKVIYIVIGILTVILFIIILDIMTGGSLFCTLVGSIVFFIPLTGSVLAHYLKCFM